MEEASEVHARNRCVVFSGVPSEWLGNEDAGVVDQRIDAAEACHSLRNHAARGSRVGDIARHRQNVGIIRRPDGPCRCDNAVVAFAESLDQFCTNAL